MPIPAAGQVALSQIETELTGASGYEENINDVSVRLFASLGNNDGVLPTGTQIRWSDFYGKGVLNLVNNSAVNNYNLRTTSDSAGYGTTYTSGKTLIKFINNSNIGSASTGLYSFSTGAFTSGDKVYVTNSSSANIIGKGGNGGNGQTRNLSGFYSFTFGEAGGPAMNLSFRCNIQNNGVVASGGNGGTGGNGNFTNYFYYTNPAGRTYGVAAGGGGGGGGAGINAGSGGAGGVGFDDYYGNANNAGGNGNSGTSTLGGSGNAGGTVTDINGGVQGVGPSGSSGTGLGAATSVAGYTTYATWSGNAPIGSTT